jgi:hypothetical protein
MDFWTFGDSFAPYGKETDWFEILVKQFIGNNYYNHYCASRDVQTIMDSFYKNLCNIKDDSLVIIWLPSMARIRYPKSPKYFDKTFESLHYTNKKDTDGLIKDFNTYEYFSHWPYENYPDGKPNYYLDFPFNTFDLLIIDKIKSMTYQYNEFEYQESIKRNLEFGVTPVDFAKFLVANKASSKNWNDIFFSLKKSCKFNILFISWTDEYIDETVIGRTQLTNEIGFWDTQHDEYIETSGKFGIEWDEHFSTKMNKEFANWVMKKYPKYFNK